METRCTGASSAGPTTAAGTAGTDGSTDDTSIGSATTTASAGDNSPAATDRRQRAVARPWADGRGRALWIVLAAPGIAWLALLFVVPFYAVLAIAGGRLDEIFLSPVPVWNPLEWSGANYAAVLHDIAGPGAFIGPILLRTLAYVVIASAICLVIAYPVGYFVARHAGRRKGLYLVLLVAPFWISYMMRMLAWIDLLQTDGYVNRALQLLHLVSHPIDWLGGEPLTVVLGLVYGYIPYLILVLYAGLDRVDPRLLEASRDLGLGRFRTFLHVCLPLTRHSVVTGLLVTALPMIGDYFTNQMLSGAAGTSMIGNVVDGQLQSASQQGQGAALSLILLGVLLAPMIAYVVAANRESRTAM